jgi:molybdate transport system regulatory protein
MDVTPRFKLWLETPSGQFVLGGGTSGLLRNIRETGSLSEAAKASNISYAHAWKKIRKAEQQLGAPLVNRSRGGTGGGSSTLSEDGEALLEKYEELKSKIRALLEEQ